MTATSSASVALIDYGSGNLRSAAKAVERAAQDAGYHGLTVTVTADPDAIARADRIILPGVGAFADCMGGLLAVDGLKAALEEAVIRRGQPFLGICVGMQLMAREGREHGVHPGLGWIDAVVERLTPADPALKIPHMGWNELVLDQADHPLLAGIAAGSHVYFVHSYGLKVGDPALLKAHADYAGPIPALVGRDNLAGTQFHPEKSQATGLKLIANFLAWTP
ncbi:imidazole glycerol phosphate synthase subunit HisH [Nitrospirillum sp. BR 11163]|uniref:imidazole glycerol phosphate synthase subunit HisH n=1 Tax=Nitrospirillum sp. BR 11163 TaxID=3104323 RepID=UPI002AFEEBDC|nr:imidazole glycerol phosphate synthase subunit HisH [Nitrospirillum sp. BR 11163]MEA1677496.1 imidazole glycerol phosphate synthase subunit HisH [Nitrospirillum sp. BR 11163]